MVLLSTQGASVTVRRPSAPQGSAVSPELVITACARMAKRRYQLARGAPERRHHPRRGGPGGRARARVRLAAAAHTAPAGHPGGSGSRSSHGVVPESDGHNGSMGRGRRCLRNFVETGDRAWSTSPHTTAPCCSSASRAPWTWSGAAARGSTGVDPAAVEAACSAGVPKLVHVIPSTSINPAGCTLAMPKRERLVALAAEHGFTLFEDDPYRLISFGGEPLKTMLEMDEADRSIHASSFSKTVSPGVRVGYLVGPGRADRDPGFSSERTSSTSSPSMIAESIVWEPCPLRRPGAEHRVVNAALRERRDVLVDSLRETCRRRPSSSPRAATSSGSISRTTSTRRSCSARRRSRGHRRRARLHARGAGTRASALSSPRAHGADPPKGSSALARAT